ncbi:MAG: ATP-binding cassette domain-containing protein [Tissierellia bacterium]|nr:ATP-binding cassette domain-containing protein [Tissierellia bacterium]
MRRNTILDALDLEVHEGEIFALMGVEGAGKTTLARILYHYLKPSSGEVRIFDMDAVKESQLVKAFCGYVPEDVWIYEHLKPMSIFKKTLSFHESRNTEDIGQLMDYFELDNRKKFGDLSDSERKRVAIINALITHPKLLILDEPTKYLSVTMVEKLFRHLKELQRTEHLTVFMLTENLTVGQKYADRAAYLSEGRIVGMEYVKEKTSSDKMLRITGETGDLSAFTQIGAAPIKDEEGEREFFYNGYLPTLTTVLYQQRIQDYTLEDAILSHKIASYATQEGDGSIFAPQEPPVAASEEAQAPEPVEDLPDTQEETMVIAPVDETVAVAPVDEAPPAVEVAPVTEAPAEEVVAQDEYAPVEAADPVPAAPVAEDEASKTQVFEPVDSYSDPSSGIVVHSPREDGPVEAQKALEDEKIVPADAQSPSGEPLIRREAYSFEPKDDKGGQL